MEAIYGYIIAAVVALAGIVGAFIKGRSDGKKLEKSKQAESDVKAQVERNDKSQEARKIETDIDQLPANDVRRRLRDKYTRD